jgi:hypothetical protein
MTDENARPSSPVDCGGDPIGSLKTLFVDMVQAGRIRQGQCPASRPVFLKPHGTVHGRLVVRADLPENFRIGIFAGAEYPAWVRFSSDTVPTASDYKTTVGIGIKLFDVPGAKLAGATDDVTSDFILQNHDRFFVDTAADMCAFTKAGVVDGDYGPYLAAHPLSAQILDEMAKPVSCVLAETFWSILPFAFGADRHVKYRLDPEATADPVDGPPSDPTYLAADLRLRLSAAEARFRLALQVRTDPASMPLDAATVRWDEDAAPWMHVATLVLDRQDIDARGQSSYGDNLAMNIWRVPAEHAPVGSLADARRVVYAASADLRRNVNGVPLGEPEQPRPSAAPPAARDMRVVAARIHPGIGIARVGDSQDEFFIGPEVTDPLAEAAGFYRDTSGALKRQAARFRLFGVNAEGAVVRELTSENANIVWTVHLANKKASWYRFLAALDVQDATTMSAARRNSAIKRDDRRQLEIDPGPRSITGAAVVGGAAHAFDTGKFKNTTVYLGELRTDDSGRLLVLGGRGRSESPSNAPVFDPNDDDSFNNADDWFDDIADGPVTASVSIDGREIPVTGAWVAVAPPNYAPNVIGWRTLHDLLLDTYVKAGWISVPAVVSFTKHILPTLLRLTNLQWVNQGFAALFGHGAPLDFSDPRLITKLATPRDAGSGSDPYGELRVRIAGAFRPADTTFGEPRLWPWIYGDAFGSFGNRNDNPRNNLALGSLQTSLIERWVAGDFVGDWNPAQREPSDITMLPLAERPAMLDKAALHFCLADAFHPGCELTWPMRHASLYSEPFRIRARLPDVPEPDFGPELTQAIAMRPGGPLYEQGPGDLSRWMAVPWQGDTAFCRSGYDPAYDPYLPTFWAARVPNQVLTQEKYAVVMDQSRPRAERVAAFQSRANWPRSLHGPPPLQMLQMIAHFGAMGLIESRPGFPDDPDFPRIIFVESVSAQKLGALFAVAKQAEERTEAAGPTDRITQAGWESEEQLEAFRTIRVRER